MKRRLIIALAILSTAALLAGCGGGGQPGSTAAPAAGLTGKAQFTVVWPAQAAPHVITPRLIPGAANSIVLTLQLGTNTPQSHILTRPAIGNTSTATFTNLPPGAYTASAAAHPNADGTGTTQAQAAAPLTISIGQTATLNMTLASTIVSVVVTPNPTRVFVNQTTQLTATAYDGPNGTGNVVLTAGFNWLSSDTNRATVDNTGLVAGVSIGTFVNAPPPVQITATDPESGVSGASAVQVLGLG